MASLLTPARERARWWVSRPDLVHHLENQSLEIDGTIARSDAGTMRRHPDISARLSVHDIEVPDLLAYQAKAKGAFGLVRLAALFWDSPYDGAEPEVLALDGERTSKHRNPPFDTGTVGSSATLCLYYDRDQPERRWSPEHGLVRLFDIARRHLDAEHLWRIKGKWPIEEAPHGRGAAPARPRPDLALDPLNPLPHALIKKP